MAATRPDIELQPTVNVKTKNALQTGCVHTDALNVYCSNGWVEIDNNIAENALRGVAVVRKSWLFAGSDSGGEHAAVLYSLIGTCRLNNMEPEKWLRYVIEHIQEWPANRVCDLLP